MSHDGTEILVGPKDLEGAAGVVGTTIGHLVAIGNQVLAGGQRTLYSFDAETLSGWTNYQLSAPAGTSYEGGYGVAVIDGELYRHVELYPLGAPPSSLVQKLVAPQPR